MEHIEAYLHLTFLKQHFGWQDDTVERILQRERHFTKWIPIKDIRHAFHEKPPTTTQLVHALERMGISPNNIADYLDISKQTVSYHRSRKNHPSYYNKYFEELTTPGAIAAMSKKRKKVNGFAYSKITYPEY